MLVAGFLLIEKKGILGLALVYVISEGVCLLLVFAIQIFGKIKDYIKEKYSFTNRVFEEYPSDRGGAASEYYEIWYRRNR